MTRSDGAEVGAEREAAEPSDPGSTAARSSWLAGPAVRTSGEFICDAPLCNAGPGIDVRIGGAVRIGGVVTEGSPGFGLSAPSAPSAPVSGIRP